MLFPVSFRVLHTLKCTFLGVSCYLTCLLSSPLPPWIPVQVERIEKWKKEFIDMDDVVSDDDIFSSLQKRLSGEGKEVCAAVRSGRRAGRREREQAERLRDCRLTATL